MIHKHVYSYITLFYLLFRELTNEGSKYLIGLKRDNGRWKWTSDKTELSFDDIDWCNYEDEETSEKNCVNYNSRANKMCWNPNPCSLAKYSICQIGKYTFQITQIL